MKPLQTANPLLYRLNDEHIRINQPWFSVLLLIILSFDFFHPAQTKISGSFVCRNFQIW